MNLFRWLEDLRKLGYLEAFDGRSFQAELSVIGDNEAKAFTVRFG